jgi:NhaP-type Na+/H+ or K+/H+ antiporter
VLPTTVIVVSLIVQGLTLEPLARFAGIAQRATRKPSPASAWWRQAWPGSASSLTAAPPQTP